MSRRETAPRKTKAQSDPVPILGVYFRMSDPSRDLSLVPGVLHGATYYTPLWQWPDATLRRFCDAHAIELRLARARVFDQSDTVAEDAQRAIARIQCKLGQYHRERSVRIALGSRSFSEAD